MDAIIDQSLTQNLKGELL